MVKEGKIKSGGGAQEVGPVLATGTLLGLFRLRMSYANRFPSSQHTRYRSSWGPSSVTVFNRADVPRPSPEEEEYAEFYHERLHSAQSRQLLPLQEDLADWINKTLSE